MRATASHDAIENAPRTELEALQLERLRETVARLLGAGRSAGVESPEEIASLDDLGGLPFTVKSDLRDNYPFGLLAVPRERLVRVHASSGTRGKPSTACSTATELRRS